MPPEENLTPEQKILRNLTSATKRAADPAVAGFFSKEVDKIVINRISASWGRWGADWLGSGDNLAPSVSLSGKTLTVTVYDGYSDSPTAIQAGIEQSLNSWWFGIQSKFNVYLHDTVSDSMVEGPQAAANLQRWANNTRASLEETQNLAAQAATTQWSIVASLSAGGEIVVSANDTYEAYRNGYKQGMVMGALGGLGGAGRAYHSVEAAADAAEMAARAQKNAAQNGQRILPNAAADSAQPVKWTNHGNKHVASAKVDWNDVVKGTQNGPAKYAPGTNIENLERMVHANGIPVTNGKPWKVMEFTDEIVASGGKSSRWMRVEESAGVIHGHPILYEEFKKLTKVVK